MIFCNPHNPIGKIWDKETLQRIGDLCAKHHVIVLSDEFIVILPILKKNISLLLPFQKQI